MSYNQNRFAVSEVGGFDQVSEIIGLCLGKKGSSSEPNEPPGSAPNLTLVVVDNLHVFESCRHTSLDKVTKIASLDRLQYIKKYEATIKSLGISVFSFWIGRESEKLKWRTLTGPTLFISSSH